MNHRSRKSQPVAYTPAPIDEEHLPLHRRPPSPESLRHDFATRVVRHLTEPGARVAVIDEQGRPAIVSCAEPLYELVSRDHPIVGVYIAGARVRDVIDDLKAAGL
jgi:hypothetical protein